MSSNPLVKRLAIVFGEPKTEDPASFLGEYARAFKGTPQHVLDTAGDVIIKQRKYRAWPTVAECLEAIEMAKRQTVNNGVALEPIENFDAWWSNICSRVHSGSEDQISAALNEVRAYHAAGWIDRGRYPWLSEVADQRRASLHAERITGERAA